MEVISLTIVGISVVFLCFVFIYVLLKAFEAIFRERKPEREEPALTKPVIGTDGGFSSISSLAVGGTGDAVITEEEVAAIGAALFAYLDKPYRLVGLRRVSQEETRCRTPRKYKTWKVHQKGDK